MAVIHVILVTITFISMVVADPRTYLIETEDVGEKGGDYGGMHWYFPGWDYGGKQGWDPAATPSTGLVDCTEFWGGKRNLVNC